MTTAPPPPAATALELNPLMSSYKASRDASRTRISLKYESQGFISQGTYGLVYKVRALPRTQPGGTGRDKLDEKGQTYAVKKFKPEKPEKDGMKGYSGLSQSACREIALNREIRHENVIALREVILESKAVFLVFEYAEHDFLQVIQHHATALLRSTIPIGVLKSLLYQLVNGVAYLHSNFIMHRDLKPANILITDKGVVKIGDLGLARVFLAPLEPLINGDKVVVTIWYRAPELLLGSKHYTTAIDMWSTGCIFAELLSLRPIFKGNELKTDGNGRLPFQRDQMIRIMEVLGTPNLEEWPLLDAMPDYAQLAVIERERSKPKRNEAPKPPKFEPQLSVWMSRYMDKMDNGKDLLARLFTWDPDYRLSAAEALLHPFFTQDAPLPTRNAFAHAAKAYPPREITTHDTTVLGEVPAAAAGHAVGVGARQAPVMGTHQPGAPAAPLAGQPPAGSGLMDGTADAGAGGAAAGGRMVLPQQATQGQQGHGPGMGMARKRPRIG